MQARPLLAQSEARTSAPVVAIFNSNDDVVEMLRFALEQSGLIVVSGHIDAIRRGEQRLADFVGKHDRLRRV